MTAVSASAATTQISVLIDSDNNPATGCSVSTATGTFSGAEQVLTTTIDTASNVVTAVTRQQCSGGVLGSSQTVDAGGWAVGTAGGLNLVETHIPWTALGATAPLRLGFTATSGTLSASVLQRPDASLIFFPALFGSGRRRVVNPAEQVNITLDGDGKDWSGIAPLAAGSASSGTAALRFMNVYAAANASDLFFRFDLQSNVSAPTANDDAYTVLSGGTLNITAPGVLTNDHDPNLLPLSAILVSGPQHGTLNLTSNGGFTYVNDGSAALVDGFRYKANNGTTDSNTAQVTLTIIKGTPPTITSANSTTFTVGTAGTFTVTKTGTPTPTLSMTGTLPAGVTFNPTTGVLSGTPAAGTGRIYNFTFVATNAAGTAVQNFTLTVNEKPSITSANATTFVVGTLSSFGVTSTGYPVPTVTETGALPAGVTFTNGVFSGNPTATGVFPITLTATNSLGTGTQNFTLTVNQAPAITSTNSAIATVGTAFTFTVTATGFPAPTLSETGALPNGITFNTATGVLSGTPAAGTGGTYSITFTATNTAGTANQPFTLTVDEAPSITSANSTTFTAGSNGSFSVGVTGFPAPVVVLGGTPLPSGLSFNNTTHVLSGTAATGTGGTYALTFTASNGIGAPAIQAFTLTVNEAPAITSANNVTFTVGALGTFTVTTRGFPLPAIVRGGVPLPGGVSFVDNGNGTGTLSGTPAALTGGTYAITFTATNSLGSTPAQNFTLTINQPPVITSANAVTFLVGQANTFSVTTTGFPAPSIAIGGALPGGVNFVDNGNGTGTLSGNPSLGTGGTYSLTFTATNSVGATPPQTFTLTVNQAPAITSTNNVAFTAGSPGTFTVTTTGFPLPSIARGGVALPSGVTFVDNGNGTGTLAGTAAALTGGAYAMTFTATNSVGSTPAQPFTLTVNEAPAVTTNPATQAVCVGLTASFNAAASGFPAPAVQWQISTDGGSTFNNIPGATSATYSFATTLADNGHLFRAVFSNGSGSATTTPAILTVDPVAIPAGLAATPGASGITISWSPSACATSYVVLRSNTSGSGYVVVGTPVATTFVDTAISNGTPYFYVVEAQNAAQTSAISAEVSAEEPADVTTCAGTTATFTSVATSTPAASVQWQVSTDGGTTFNDVPGATSTTLSFVPAGSDNGNLYHAVFTGVFGTATSRNAALTVHTSPVVTTDPLSQAVCDGSTATFSAAATGNPTPTVQWQISIDGGANFNNIVGATSTTYSFTTSAADNLHQFRAVFTNICSTTTTAAAVLTIDEPLTITTQPVDDTLQAGSTASFTAAASGTSTVQWQVETNVGTTFNDIPGATSPTLTFLADISLDGYKYRAVFTNSCGSVTSNFATLHVTCVPLTVTRTGGGTFPAATFNTAYAGQSVTASGGTGPYTFAVTAGALPGGLSLTTSGVGAGTISGAPTATGTFGFTITATDTTNGCTGTQSFSIAVNPAPTNDSYANLVNNTQAVVTGGTTGSPSTPFVSLTGSITANDFPSGGVTATAGTFSTAQGGSVTIQTDGTFIYTPPVTATALTSDSFTYTALSDTGVTGTPTQATGTVNLTLAGRVWYVNNSGANGNGQSQSPFNSLSNFTNGGRTSPDKANDIIFVYNGNSATTPYGGGIVLIDNETLQGEGSALVVNSQTLVPAGTKPQITIAAASSNAIQLANGDTVKGVTAEAATRCGISGSNMAGFTGDNLALQNNSTCGIEFSNMTGTMTLTNSTISNNGSFNLWITQGTGTVNVDNTNTITASGTQRSVVVGSRPLGAGNINIGATINDSGAGFDIESNQSGSINFTGSQTLGNHSSLIQSNTGATLNFSGTLSITTTNGTGLPMNGGGTLNVTGTATITTTTGNGLDLNGITIGASGVTFSSISTTSPTAGINLASLSGGGTITVNGGTIHAITGVSLSTLGTTTLNLNGVTIADTNGATGGGIIGTSFGTLNLNNTSVTSIGITPGVQLTTGTLSASGTSSITGGGSGLLLSSVAITNGSTFTSVSSSGGTNGIALTGVTGGSLGLGTGALTGASGATFLVSGGSPNVTYNGTINQASSANAVSISGATSASISLGGNITANTGTQNAITLTSNTGSAITFGGKLTLTTSSGVAFNATTNGSVTANGSGSVLTTTAGTAVNISSAALNITFQAVNATGGSKGMSLNTTTGTFTVAGNGGLCTSTTSTCTGGTIQSMTSRGAEFLNAAGVTLNKMFFKNDGTASTGTCVNDISGGSNSGCNAALHLGSNTSGTTLNDLLFDGTSSAENGVNGNSVSALTISNLEMQNFTASGKSAFCFQNLTGVSSITGLNMHGNQSALASNVSITNNTGNGNIAFTSPSINNTSISSGTTKGLVVHTYNALTTLQVSWTNGTINNVASDATDIGPDTGSSMTSILSGGSATNTTGIGMFSQGNNTTMNFTITGMTITTNTNGTSSIVAGRVSGTSVSENGTITNNTITTGSSLCSTCFGIDLSSASSSGSATYNISNNTIAGNNYEGIRAIAEGTPTSPSSNHTTLTIQGNTISTTQVPPNAGYAIDLQSGSGVGSDTTCMSANIGNMSGGTVNTINGTAWNSGGSTISLVIFDNATFNLPGLTTFTDAGAAAYTAAHNTNGATDAFNLGSQNWGSSTCP